MDFFLLICINENSLDIPNNAIETTCFFTWKGEDGIVRTKVKLNANVDLNEAKENSDAVNSFYIGEKYPLIIDARGIKNITREARVQFSTNGRETYVSYFALIIGSPISRVVGNFFISINKPKVPTKLFENEKKALIWLNTLKNI